MAAQADAVIATDPASRLAVLCSLIEFLILFLERKKYLKECHLCANFENMFICFLFFFRGWKRIILREGKCFCFIGLRALTVMLLLIWCCNVT